MKRFAFEGRPVFSLNTSYFDFHALKGKIIKVGLEVGLFSSRPYISVGTLIKVHQMLKTNLSVGALSRVCWMLYSGTKLRTQ